MQACVGGTSELKRCVNKYMHGVMVLQISVCKLASHKEDSEAHVYKHGHGGMEVAHMGL